jgi:hypothetical protein
MNVFEKSIDETYAISVNQYGGLQLVRSGDPRMTDKSQSQPAWYEARDMAPNVSDTLWDSIKDLVLIGAMDKVRDDVKQLSQGDLHELPISELQSLVFPGAKIFTYKEPFFSDHQDLVCKITYVDPGEVIPPPQHTRQFQQSPSASPASTAGKLTGSTELM